MSIWCLSGITCIRTWTGSVKHTGSTVVNVAVGTCLTVINILVESSTTLSSYNTTTLHHVPTPATLGSKFLLHCSHLYRTKSVLVYPAPVLPVIFTTTKGILAAFVSKQILWFGFGNCHVITWQAVAAHVLEDSESGAFIV